MGGDPATETLLEVASSQVKAPTLALLPTLDTQGNPRATFHQPASTAMPREIPQILPAAMTHGMLVMGKVVAQVTGSQGKRDPLLHMMTPGVAAAHASHGCQLTAGPAAEIETARAQTGALPCTGQTAAGSQIGRGTATAAAAAEAKSTRHLTAAAATAEKGQTTG